MSRRQPVDLNSHLNANVSRGNPADFPVTLQPVFHEDRDAREFRVAALCLAELVSIHLRHGEIEQDHARPEALAQQIERFTPIADGDGVVGFVLEDRVRRGIMAAHLEPAYKGFAQGPLPVTERLTTRTLILPLFQPVRLAEEIATLDVLSAGRVDFGVSRGNTSRYFDAWGLDYADRSAAFDQVFGTILRCWTAPTVQVGSRVESIEPKCVQRPHPPIYVATYREESAAWVGQHGYTLFQGSQQSVASIRRCVRAYTDAGGSMATRAVASVSP